MRPLHKILISLTVLGFCVSLLAFPAMAELPGFDPSQISDMSDFDPNKDTYEGDDTIKIGLVEAFSGPAAINGQYYRLTTHWVAHDINKRGGIFVDGKKRKVQVVLGNSMGKPAMVKKAAERLILRDKVHFLWGTAGSHNTKILSQVADKYKTIFMNPMSLSDYLHNGQNFSRYTFRTTLNTTMLGRALAYFYKDRPEKRFYILNQDYGFGHALADSIKKALKEFRPDAEIVGESFHPLFLKDFAPYITKVMASDAEVVFTGDWDPDGANLIRQARGMGMKLPFAHIYADSLVTGRAIGPEGGKGMVNANDYMITVDNPRNNKFIEVWHKRWKQGYDKPYGRPTYKWPSTIFGRTSEATYWMLDVLRRAGTLDADKIIETWEGDKWLGLSGVLEMRACDHQVIRDMFVTEFIFPNKWFDDAAAYGDPVVMPRHIAISPVPADLERCHK